MAIFEKNNTWAELPGGFDSEALATNYQALHENSLNQILSLSDNELCPLFTDSDGNSLSRAEINLLLGVPEDYYPRQSDSQHTNL